MWKHYLTITLRYLSRRKSYAIVNLVGLTVGISGTLLILSFVAHEQSWERFHEHGDDIYRVYTGQMGDEDAWAGTPAPLVSALTAAFPEITAATRTDDFLASVRIDGRTFTEKKVLAVDSSFLDLFTFPLVRSKTPDPLARPDAIVLTESAARTYFGNTDPIGRTLTFADQHVLEVTGILKDIPRETHLQFTALVRFDTIYKDYSDSWGAYNFATYIRTTPGIHADDLQEKIRAFTVERADHTTQSLDGMGLQRLNEIHFQYIRGNSEPVFERRYLFVLISVAFILLVLASISYINVSTAVAPLRAREIGIRKVVGSGRNRIAIQLLTESVLLVLAAAVLAVVLASALAPYLERTAGVVTAFKPFALPTILMLAVIVLVVGIGSGSFSAFYLSGFQPIDILARRIGGRRKSSIRNVLVTVQFGLSILLLFGTAVILRQVRHLQSADIGLDRDLVVNIPLHTYANKGLEIKKAFLNLAGVRAASVNSYSPGEDSEHWGIEVEGQQDYLGVYVLFADADFLSVFGVPLLEGAETVRHFDFTDRVGFLLNESAFARTGWDKASGRKINGEEVLGVVRDFNFRSLHHGIEPLIIVLWNRGDQISVKLAGNKVRPILAELEKSFHTFAPDIPFEYSFFDDDYNLLYASEERAGRAILFFTVLSLVIAGVGLFGLASFITTSRTKEIGVRKVMGASTQRIVSSHLNEFGRLIVLANVVVCPLAWFAADRWLRHFAYRIDLDASLLLVAAGISLLTAFMAVVYQIIRAATVNPVESLRYE